MQPHLALFCLWAAPVHVQQQTLPPRCSRNNCFTVMLAVAVVSCCSGVPLCRLKGYLDLLTVTKLLNRGSDLGQGVNKVLDCTFYALASPGRKNAVIHQRRGNCHRHWLPHKGLNSWVDHLLCS